MHLAIEEEASAKGGALLGRAAHRHGALDPRLAVYDYELPADRIARHPPPERDGGRLLVVGAAGLADRLVTDLPELIEPGDVLVVNDTRVLRARLFARRASGGRVEVLLLAGSEGADSEGTVEAMLRPSRRLQPGERLGLRTGHVELVERTRGGGWRVRVHPSPDRVMAAEGEVPLPPYLRRDAEPADRLRYQTVFAAEPGAVAAPTAGLHLTEALLDRVRARGAEIATITLHVGAGTFRSLLPEDLDAGRLHTERYAIPEHTAHAIARTRARGGRVIAVGTTTTRALESAARGADGPEIVRPGAEGTDLFIRPGFRFRVIDRLWTNFHLPRSSLLMLVAAFGGRERIMAAYRHAIAAGYRFYSYGDAMLVDPDPAAR